MYINRTEKESTLRKMNIFFPKSQENVHDVSLNLLSKPIEKQL